MNHFSIQENAMAACKEMGNLVLVTDHSGPVFCPKPRRVGILTNNLCRPFRPQISHNGGVCDSRAAADMLDFIIMKESRGFELSDSNQVISSPPPFYSGSPPSRAGNPLIKDVRFGQDKFSPISTLQIPSPLSSPSSAARKAGGCARIKFGVEPAVVRVEGFYCQNSVVSATVA